MGTLRNSASSGRVHMSFLSKLFKRTPKQSARVTFDDDCVTRTMSNGVVEKVRWVDLEEVGILTTDEGPFADDVIWMLLGKNGTGCAVPSDTEGMGELLSRLQQLPEFDNEAVVKAMGSTDNAKFVCWKRAL
jgi:hypothetical protein